MLYVDSHGAGSPQGNCRDFRSVGSEKGDDLKQIVKHPARIKYAVSRVNCNLHINNIQIFEENDSIIGHFLQSPNKQKEADTVRHRPIKSKDFKLF